MSKILYDSVLVAHIKTTCNRDNEDLKEKQVIEFGACLLNLGTLRAHEPFSVLIKPTKEISQYCTKRTGIAPEDISSGASFFDAMEAVRDMFDSNAHPWASYGTFAHDILRRQCADMKVLYPFSNRFLDVKSLFAMMFNLTNEVSPKEAMRKLNLHLPEAKDSQDEALNAALILSECFRGPSALEGNFVTTKVEVKRKK